MNKPYNIQNTDICNGIFHISFFKALLINEGETTHIPLGHSGQVSGSDVEYYTVLLLTLRYVHELSIRRYTCTTEGQYENVGAVVIVWYLD